MTIALEDVSLGGDHIDAEALQRNTDRLNGLFPLDPSLLGNGVLFWPPTTVKRSGQNGTGTVVFTASTVSALLVVNHNLGVVPQMVQATVSNGALGYGLTTSAKTTTTFSVQGWSPSSSTANVGFDWLVIG